MKRGSVTESSSRWFSWIPQPLRVTGVAIALLLVFLLTPAIAQDDLRAPVVLDGRQIFQVSASGQIDAADRAKIINTTLEDAVQSQQPPIVRVEERNKVPTVFLNDSYVLSVTELDTEPGSTSLEQARTWAQQIQEAIQQGQRERSGQFIRDASFLSGAIVLLAIAAHWSLGWLWRRLLQRALQFVMPTVEETSNTNQPTALYLFLRLTLAIARAVLWISATFYITNLFPFTRQWSYRIPRTLITTFTSPILTLGQNGYSISNLLILTSLLLGWVIIAGSITNVLRSRVLHITGINRGAQEAVAIITKYSLISIGSIVLLQVWGLDISSLTILASALSVGIGFGLQDIAKNFGSGLVLVFERPIQIGDFIEVGEFMGTVERMGARSTVIRTLDQVSIIVPNSRFLEKEVINWSHDNPISRLHLPVGVAYHSDIESVQSTLLDAAKDHPKVLSIPSPIVLFKGFGDSSLNLELLVWTAEPSQQFRLKSDLYFRIEALLRQQKIEIPFPQRDLNLRMDHLPVELSPEIKLALLQLSEKFTNGQKLSVEDTEAEKS